jgi:hypothetical protein
MEKDNLYWVISGWLSRIVSVVVFFGSYYFCITTYGYSFGLGFGWIPSMIAAGLAGLATIFLWPVAAVGILFLMNPG